MGFDDLVRTITQEVLKQIHTEAVPKKCVRVLASREETSAQIHGLVGEDVEIIYSGDDVTGRVISRYILPVLSCSDMADLAAGRASGSCMTEVLNLLLEGIEVEVVEFGYKEFQDTASGPLFSMYESYMIKLASFGLIPFRIKRPDTVRLWQKLVTEQSVQDANEQEASVLQVPESAKITPLAAETASLLGVSIKKCL